MPAPAPNSPLRERLIARIRADGPITFAAYMEACLYDPEYGYYSGGLDRRRADYYTSVDVSPVFGRLLARQLEEMWRALDRPQFAIVEGGAAPVRWRSKYLISPKSGCPSFIRRSIIPQWKFRRRDVNRACCDRAA